MLHHASEMFDSMWQATFRAQAAFPVLSLKPAERTIEAAGGSTMRRWVVAAAYESLQQT